MKKKKTVHQASPLPAEKKNLAATCMKKKKRTYIDRRGCSGSLSNEGAVAVIWGRHALLLRAHTIVLKASDTCS